MSYRDTAYFGKRQEFVAMAELLKRGFDVYDTMVDDQGIDCIIRIPKDDGSARYLDIQIKARSKNVNPKNAGFFGPMKIDVRDNYWFIFYSEWIGKYWIMSSSEVIERGNMNKSGVTAGKYKVKTTNYSTARDEVTPRPIFSEYENNFKRLWDA